MKEMQIREGGLRAAQCFGISRLTGRKQKTGGEIRVRGLDEEREQLKEEERFLCSLPSCVSGNVRVCWRWNGNGCCGQA